MGSSFTPGSVFPCPGTGISATGLCSSANPAVPEPRGRGCSENDTSDCERKIQICLGSRRERENVSPLLAPACPTHCSWRRPIFAALSRARCCLQGFSPSAGIGQLRRATAPWLRGRRKAKKQSVLALIKSHIFLTSYFTNKTKAALKWMPGLAGCQRRAGDKGWEYKCGAGSGEPRMPLRQGERVAMETWWPNRGKKGPALGWTGSHRRHRTQETGALVPPVPSWAPRDGACAREAGPDAGSSSRRCPGPGLSWWARTENGVLGKHTCFKQKGGHLGVLVQLPSTGLAP